MKSFVTLFPASQNVHLLKDVGMIPYIMYRDYGYDSTLVCFPNEESYPALEREVKGLKIHFLKKDTGYRFGKPSSKVLSYLRKNAKRIDILNLYHTTKETLLYGLIYKIYNPTGILYVKLDLERDHFAAGLNRFKKQGYSLFFTQIADIISYELDHVGDFLKEQFPAARKRLFKITNGIDAGFITKQQTKKLLFEEKENLIITVGRIGTEQKNSELFLRAIEKVNLNNWKIAFIGPVEKGFETEIKSFFTKNPQLKEKVIFTGSIYDRKALYEWYNRAKVFCLTSRWESFGIVLVEALYFGNYIFSTDIASIREITDNERVGRIVADDKELTKELQNIIDESSNLENLYPAILKQGEHFIWTTILSSLDEQLKAIQL